MKGSAKAGVVIAAPAKAEDRLGKDSEWTICVSRRCRRIPQIISALISVNLREIIFLCVLQILISAVK